MRRYCHCILLCVFLSANIIPDLQAQKTRMVFNHYSAENGLIYDQIEYVHIDKEGYTWIATAIGLQRFDGYSFKDFNYVPDDSSSVSDNFITSISEDNKGNIWIGTSSHGLNLFDKELDRFIHFRHDPNLFTTLTSDNIPRAQKVITQDRDGYLWVNTDNGLNKVDPTTRSIERYYGDFKGQIIYDEQEHTLWIAGKKLKKFNIKTKSLEHFDINSSGINVQLISSIIMDRDGLIWLSSEAGIFIFDKDVNHFIDLTDLFPPSKEGNQQYRWSQKLIGSIHQDYEGLIWVACGDEIYVFNKSDGSYRVLTHEPDNQNSLLGEDISGIYGNKRGVIWVTYTNRGLSKINIKEKGFTAYSHNPNNPNSLSGNTVRSVFLDKKQNLWVGTYNNGLNHFLDQKTENAIHYFHDPDNINTINSNYVTAIHVDSHQRLWVGSFEKGFCFADNIYDPGPLKFQRFKAPGNMEIHEFTEDKVGRIWISTNNGLYFYNRELERLLKYGQQENHTSELEDVNIQSIAFQEPNIFWLATWNRGIGKLFINSDSMFTPSIGKDTLMIFDRIEEYQNHLVIDNRFITIYEGGPNQYWLGSNANGLIKMTENNEQLEFIKYDKSNGAPGNSVYGIAGDESGNIWISTNYGLGKFNPETEQFKNYYESHGLQSNSFIWDASYQSEDGRIFFGGNNGLTAFYPDSISDNITVSRPFISKLNILYREVNAGEEFNGRVVLKKNIRYTETLTLTHREPVFSLEFAAMDPVSPAKVLYAYKLVGFDEDWIFTNSDNRNATYTNLREGTYHFNVKASNSDGIWNEEPTVLGIIVLPPWWREWWAYIIYVAIFLGLLYAFRTYLLKWANLKHNLQLERVTHEKDNELNQAKLRFFTNISHELRTPLTLILDPLDRLIETPPSSRRVQRQLNIMIRNSHRLMRLINQLMDFRKFESDKLDLKVAKGNIIKFTNEVIISFKQHARDKSINFKFKHEEEQLEAWYDRDKLEIILYNLISNAFKFTPEYGKITVEVARKKIEDSGFLDSLTTVKFGQLSPSCQDIVEINVSDNGSGISAENLKMIFERYYQGKEGEFAISAGTGIGLALTKNMVELHGGIISVQSQKGLGSQFKVGLPLGTDHFKDSQVIRDFRNSEDSRHYEAPEKIEPDILSDVPVGTEEEVMGKPSLLIVDDNSEVRNYIAETFQPFYHVFEASDGKQAYDIAIDKIPDLVISDILMPVMDGIELCHELKSNVKTSHIPIILLTARTSLIYRIEGLETGADDYLTKPFSSKLLQARVSNLIASRKRMIDQFKKEVLLDPKDITLTSPDESFLKTVIQTTEKFLSDPEFNVQMMAKEIGLSHSLLYKKIHALTGMSVVEFIRTIRLKRAAQILANNNLSIAEVSDLVGFSDPKYFSKCFAKQFGKTPTRYATHVHPE